MAQARQHRLQRTAAVAERDAQVRDGGERAAGDHRRRRQTNLAGKRDHLLQIGRADQPLHANRTQRMDEHRRADVRCGLEERPKARVANRHAVDMAGDLDTGQSLLADHRIQLDGRQVNVLQRHCAQAEEATWRLRHHAGDHLVQVATHALAVLGRQPVRQQFRHRRQHLPGHRLPVHVGQPHPAIPALVRDGAVDLARDHHMPVAGLGRRHARPGGVGMAPQVGREALGHHVGVAVDQVVGSVVKGCHRPLVLWLRPPPAL